MGQLASAGEQSSARAVILVVEDETLIRMNTAEVLIDAGYDVLEAGNADDAIALLESRDDIALIFTDIDMPGSMNGIKLAQAAHGRWPPIKIIATSGHFKIQPGDLPENGRFLSKPYSSQQVKRAINEAIAS